MKQAMATVNPKVQYINTHGTSTKVGDTKELEAIRIYCITFSTSQSRSHHAHSKKNARYSVFQIK